MKQLSRELLQQIADDKIVAGVDYGNDVPQAMARLLLAGMAQEPLAVVECWACKKDVEVSAIGDCDGYCPSCGNPIDLDDEPYGAPPAPVMSELVWSGYDLAAPEPVSNRDELPAGIPDRIWLNTAGEWPADGTEGEVTWCRDQQHELDTMYVRADVWIPCRERMPEVGDVVLTAKAGCVNVGEMERSGANFRYFTSVVSGRELPADHWQPLPAPPKDGV